MKKDIKWLKKELKKCLATSLKYDNHYAYGNRDAYNIALSYVDELEKPDKPVIPQFVADWIESQLKFGYEDVFISMTRLRERAPEEVKFWFNNNPDTYARAWMDGFEVEKEKLYYVRAGSRHVRFNLDGSIIGAKKGNSIVGLERLSKLPFDYKKAVESGIITLEEVTE